MLTHDHRKRTLEELDFIFGVPTKKHIHYQVTKWLPWWVKRYVFWRRNVKLEPLYKLDVPDDGAGAQ